MERELIFAGDELELLVALDALGCVLTDNGVFYCDMDNRKLQYTNRLPARIRGTYTREDAGWRICYRATPAPKTVGIFLLFAVFLLAFLVSGNFTGAGLFGILAGAMAVNHITQRNSCLTRFESGLSGRMDME